MTTTALDQIAHRQLARRTRDLAFALLLAAIATFSAATIGTANPVATAHAAPAAVTAPTAHIVVADACVLDLEC